MGLPLPRKCRDRIPSIAAISTDGGHRHSLMSGRLPVKRCSVPTFVLLLLCVVSAPAWAGDLTLKRVMLSTGGVAYLEYEAAVDGDATLTLNVPLDQVDDVLKSI